MKKHPFSSNPRLRAGFAGLLLAGVVWTGHATADIVKVFVFSGQSNMTGTYAGDVAGDPLLSPQTDVWFDDLRIDLPVVQTDWAVLDPLGGPRFGPEINFGHVYTAANPLPDTRLAIMKVSQPATDSNHWAPVASRADASYNNAQGYYALMDRIDVINARLEAQVTAGEIDGYEWAGMIWMQGEGDADGNNFYSWEIDEYISNTTTLFNDVRLKLGNAELPIVLGRLTSELDDAVAIPAKLDAIRAAQVGIAEADPFISWINTDDLPLKAPGDYHYTGAGYLGMGERFGEEYLNLTSIPEPGTAGLLVLGAALCARTVRARWERSA